MPIHASIPTVSFAQAREAVISLVRADIPVLLLGDPGVGKSALARQVADEVGLPLGTLLGSTCDPTDIGGLPLRNGKAVDRVPLRVVRDACERPGLFFLDEISCASPSVQAALLRLMLERVAGDCTLHPGSRIISAANPPEQAPGGFELSAPLIGRVCILHLRPTEKEVLMYLSTLGEEGSQLRFQALDLIYTCQFVSGILEIDIPSAAIGGNIPWGAPRSWERALRSRAKAVEAGADATVVHTLTAGSVGEERATAFEAIVRLREILPTVEDVVRAPQTAMVPEEPRHQVAALGLIARVASHNTWSAWIYALRLRPELGAACAKHLLALPDSSVSAPFAREGVQARIKLSAIAKAV